jgi:hypothetical protein
VLSTDPQHRNFQSNPCADALEDEVARGMGCDRIQNVQLIDNEAETRAVFDLIISNPLSGTSRTTARRAPDAWRFLHALADL